MYLVRRRKMEQELAEEIDTHRMLLERSMLDSRRLMGNIELAKEECRDIWIWRQLDVIWRDVRHAWRGLTRSPGFAITAVISLGLGIGANTAIFSFVNGMLLKRLAVPQADGLVMFSETYRGETSGIVWRLSTIDGLAKRDSAFSGIFGRFPARVSFSTHDTSRWLMGELVTGQYFQTLGIQPAIGRLLTPNDVENASANPVCVISYDLWQSDFGCDLGVVGQKIFLNEHGYQVLGVTAKGFYGTEMQHRFDVQIPATRVADFMVGFGDGLSWLSPMARLKPGISRSEAEIKTSQALMDVHRERDQHAATSERKLQLESGVEGFSAMREQFARPVLVLLAVAALVLLIACANLANLLLARAQARSKEFAVRMSIGCSRSRIIGQLFTESLMIAMLGCAGGIVLSLWITNALLSFLNTGKSAAAALHVTPDGNVLLFSVGLSLLTAMLFGLLPAWQATRFSLLPNLQQDVSRSDEGRLVLRKGLVVMQIAMSLVVIFAAGLLTQTLRTLQTVDLGFEPTHLIALSVDPAANGHSKSETSLMMHDILKRMEALRGVQVASMAASTPNGAFEVTMSTHVPGYTSKGDWDEIVAFNFVTPKYFRTLEEQLLQGRDFNDGDRENTRKVAIVNRKFAQHFFGERNPVGQMFYDGGDQLEIVGLVEDARTHGFRGTPAETVYLPETQAQMAGLTLLIRSREEPANVTPSLLAIVKSVDPGMPVISVRTVETDLQAGLSSERILSYLSSLFAALAAIVASVGLYGVLAYSVGRRTREIGIRVAIGALRRDVASLFGRENVLLLLAGLVIGTPMALAAGHALRGLLFGVSTTDPGTLILSLGLLAMSAVLGMAIPLWRAVNVNPLVALRYE